MLHNAGVFMLGAEENDLCIFLDFNRMPRRPIEEIPCVGHFLSSVSIAGGQPSFQDIPPVGGLAQIAFEPLEQGGNIQPCRQGKILSALS